VTERAIKPSTQFVIDQPRSLGVVAIAAAAQAAGHANIDKKRVWGIWAKYPDKVRKRATTKSGTSKPGPKPGGNGNGKAHANGKTGNGKSAAEMVETLKVAKALLRPGPLPPTLDPSVVEDVRRMAYLHGTRNIRAALEALESE